MTPHLEQVGLSACAHRIATKLRSCEDAFYRALIDYTSETLARQQRSSFVSTTCKLWECKNSHSHEHGTLATQTQVCPAAS
jgi:hypothetical protein